MGPGASSANRFVLFANPDWLHTNQQYSPSSEWSACCGPTPLPITIAAAARSAAIFLACVEFARITMIFWRPVVLGHHGSDGKRS